MCDSTNAERPGYTPRKYGLHLERYFAIKDRRTCGHLFLKHPPVQQIKTPPPNTAESGADRPVDVNIVNAAIRLAIWISPRGLADIRNKKTFPVR